MTESQQDPGAVHGYVLIVLLNGKGREGGRGCKESSQRKLQQM